VQRIAPLACAQAEAAWLRGDAAGCRAALRVLQSQAGAGVNAWEAGEVAAWRRRAGEAGVPVPPHAARPWRLELDGDPKAAAQAWLDLGAPNEAVLAMIQAACRDPQGCAADLLAQALHRAEGIGANRAAARARSLADQWGLRLALPGPPRKAPAPRRAAGRRDGLSARQQQVLGLLALGLPDTGIAARLGVTRRTAEHHVAAVLGKLSAASRAEAVARARALGVLPPLY
jgi:DNA-binding CsgD family transcriptional regulator